LKQAAHVAETPDSLILTKPANTFGVRRGRAMTQDVDPARAPEFLTRAGVARLLGVSPNTVSRWAREGRLGCQKTLGGHRRFDRSAIEQLRQQMRGELES
jgi:excisionase family DNA binding protein